MQSYRTNLVMDWKPYIDSKENYFVCCDSKEEQESLDNNNNSNNNNTYLEDTECVPYHNQWYEVAQSQNRMGRLSATSCDVGNFSIPRPILPMPIDNGSDNPNANPNADATAITTTKSGAATIQRYQCCKSGSAMQPFVNDSVFRINVYVPLVLYITVAMLLTTIVTSLLVPFLIELFDTQKKKKNKNNGNNSSSNSNHRFRRRTNSTASNAQQKYSTYNLYIIYLVLPDLVYLLCLMTFSIQNIRQQFDPNFYTIEVWPAGTLRQNYEEIYLLLPYVIANAWINSIISYKVVSLLKASKSVKRITQPSPKGVTLEACAVYCLVGLSALGFHYLNKINFIACWLVFSGLVVPPCSYILYAPITVWRNKYLPPLETILKRSNTTTERLRDRAIRELALYFFRIIAAYCITVLPAIFFWMYGYFQMYFATNGGTGSDWAVFAFRVLAMLQMIVSSGFVLTKSDVRKYVWDLVTLSYVFGKDNVPENVATTTTKQQQQQQQQQANKDNKKPKYHHPSLRFGKKDRKDDSKPSPAAIISELDPPVSKISQTTATTAKISRVEVASGIDDNDNDNDNDDDDDAGARNAKAGIGDAYNDGAACALNTTEGSDGENNDDSEVLISSIFGFHRPQEISLGAEEEEEEGKPQEKSIGEAKKTLSGSEFLEGGRFATREETAMNSGDEPRDDRIPLAIVDSSHIMEESEEIIFVNDSNWVPESP